VRDGSYLLPEAEGTAFVPLVGEALAHGGQASVMRLVPCDEAQAAEVRALFDRAEAYAQWRGEADALATELGSLGETEARRRLRGCAEALVALERIDFYPGPARVQAQQHLAELRTRLDALHSRGEPQARADEQLPRLDRARFQARRWATRARPWVDRLACAWLIRRFIDPEAQLLWLADTAAVPRGAIGFDFDGARFSHVGARVTFEVLLASFGLDDDAALRRIGAAVHFLDAGGIPVPEAAGLEAVLAGLREVHADDDALAAAAAVVFDALYAAPGTRP
jgi:hypothetical protein